MVEARRGWICGLVLGGVAGLAAAQDFHTPPGKWTEPRIYHTSLDDRDPLHRKLAGQIELGRSRPAPASTQKVLSPNRAYWSVLSVPPCTAPAGANDAVISVFTERDYWLSVTLADADCRYPPEVRWVNEKLLSVRVWWGRAIGTDLIVDVERERLVYRELFHDGQSVFEQWRSRKP